MVKITDSLKLKTGKLIKLKKKLSCKNVGIYAAECMECNEYYVGQTITSFSQRWCSHRYNWKNIDKNEVSDRAALKLHYNKKHPTIIKEFEKAFTITFLDSSEDQAEIDAL